MESVITYDSQLATYACHPQASRGRLYPESESATRTCFQRDRDRIIHSAAFRRLEYKTQVFVNHEGDHYRTRLTHTLEVAQIARTLARCLGLNEDLAEALALAHDLGHPPFGHAGEYALSDLMAPYGGFDHNAQSLSVIVRLERRYPNFDGLNLTWETLEGIVNHDIDDGLRAELFNMEDLFDLPGGGEIFQKVVAGFPDIGKSRQRHEAVRDLIGAMVTDCLTETQQRLKEAAPSNVVDIRALGRPVVSFSEAMHEIDRSLKDFLFSNMYRHDRVNKMTIKARDVVSELFNLLLAEPEKLPVEWQHNIDGKNNEQTAQVVADYIAGMTDRFAYDEHDKLVSK